MPAHPSRTLPAEVLEIETSVDICRDQLSGILSDLADRLDDVLAASRPLPLVIPDPAAIPERGLGIDALNTLWDEIVTGSAMLGSPGMIGHMNTAPHLIASLTDALVSQINNNLIFRELSPFASRVEELLIAEFAARLGLPPQTTGTFCSGGSLANLTALFAAVGGFKDLSRRDSTVVLFGESAHSSIPKAASILGIPARNLIAVRTDCGGHIDPGALDEQLAMQPAHRRKIVVATLGSTLQGAVDDIATVSEISRRRGAWLHVDAVYGGNLAFSLRHRHLLRGLKHANSIAVAPQKWLYVPRLSALVLILDADSFNASLDWPLPYSMTDDSHRGRWGIQSSRRADAVTLWVMLQIVGSHTIGTWLDRSIELTQTFYRLLEGNPRTTPQHCPDLALQLFQVGPRKSASELARKLHDELVREGRYWISLAEWRGQTFFRAALLNRATRTEHLKELLERLG
jgi:glutamate/tyrosine decarboxylase-like PLP-dependent enzyme